MTPQVQEMSASSARVQIPIRNLWLLHLYAADRPLLSGLVRAGADENPDRLPNLVTEVLCGLLERRLRRNLSPGYVARARTSPTVRGRINVAATLTRGLLDRGLVEVRYDELVVDTPRNRYIAETLALAAQLVDDAELAHRARAARQTMIQSGVTPGYPLNYRAHSDQFGRHDADDARIVGLARLLREFMIPNQSEGGRASVDINRDDVALRKLFEKAVAGYFSAVHSDRFVVAPGKKLDWQINRATERARALFPGMIADVVLDERGGSRRVIVDTKFNSVLVAGRYCGETFRSGYVYQMYAYLRSQERHDDARTLSSEGVLLHPTTDGDFDESVWLLGHRLRFATVDLSGSVAAIRARLHSIATG